MRYINIQDLELPDGWLDKAKTLTEKLKNAPDEAARKDIIKKNEIWRELFVPLNELSNGKCWYSEVIDAMSDRDIDHFRPKNEAKNIDGIPRASEEGYWRLTYDWENYRFSSTYSNQKRYDKFDAKKGIRGKSSFFPLFENSIVATTKNRCADEDIMLLDPCDEDDPGLLTFDKSGTAIPNTNAIYSEKEKKRVTVSIKLYHLDHEPLREKREKVWDRCERYINEIREISIKDDISISEKGRAKFLNSEIRRMVEKSEELSAVAIACCENNGLSRLTGRI